MEHPTRCIPQAYCCSCCPPLPPVLPAAGVAVRWGHRHQCRWAASGASAGFWSYAVAPAACCKSGSATEPPPARCARLPAAIVGGMVGALWGAAAIPAWMSQPVLEYMGLPEQGGDNQVPRPAELRAGALPDLARALLDAGAAVERASETPKQVGTDPVAAEERAAGAVVQ